MGGSLTGVSAGAIKYLFGDLREVDGHGESAGPATVVAGPP